MSEKELVGIYIGMFIDLQRIEKLSGEDREKEIKNQLMEVRAKLEAMGIVTDELKIV